MFKEEEFRTNWIARFAKCGLTQEEAEGEYAICEEAAEHSPLHIAVFLLKRYKKIKVAR